MGTNLTSNSNEPEYKRLGDLLYKIVGYHLIEINQQSYEYGLIGIAYADMRTSPMCPPGKFANKLSKKEFDKYYKIAIEKINLLNKS